ncbi:MATE family multidrug resistance protein [Pseudomonas sp. S30_BP2TU TE3576]
MEVFRIAIPLIFSRLGDLTASLIYFSFVGHFIVDSLSSASFALASISFLTVVGFGFFSTTLLKVAGSYDLNTSGIESEIIISIRFAILFGVLIIGAIFFTSTTTLNSFAGLGQTEEFKALLTLSLSMPAIYLQITIFNFFNGVKKPQYEVIFTWLFNFSLLVACAILITMESGKTLSKFILIYSSLRCIFSALALFFLNLKIQQHIENFLHTRCLPKKEYINYTIRGLPIALCLGGESFLFLMLSIISKNLSDSSLSAYQASLHFISIIYMISIGVGNATGIVAARYYTAMDIQSIIKTYTQGITLGLIILTPLLIGCFFLNEYISIIYTSDAPTRKLIENNIHISIPFLVFEFVYIVTRMTLRSMEDFWIPTLLTILILNIFGIVFSVSLLSLYDYTVQSIFLALVLCSFILMLFLLWRLKSISKKKTITTDQQNKLKTCTNKTRTEK